MLLLESKLLYYFQKELDMAKKEFKKALSREESSIAKSYLLTLSQIDEKADKKHQITKSSNLSNEKKESLSFLNRKRYHK